ncbi:MAG TPA: hypothetical protein VKB47_05470, partial [Terracidiphilus sp.]|nr:hypothetical protein [Terracidiphilus sp.]
FDKEMYMIRHHFHCVDRHAQFIGFFFELLLQPSIDRLHKHRASIFGTPDNMILQRENATALADLLWLNLRRDKLETSYRG